MRQGVRHAFGRFGQDVARGLRIRCDWGPQYIADTINEVKWLGLTNTPSYVGEPECNGVIERFNRTLKEHCIYLHRFQNLAEAQRLIGSATGCLRLLEPRRERRSDDRAETAALGSTIVTGAIP